MTCKCTCKNCCCNKPKEEAIVCEAGFLWRRVLRRLEKRVNEMLAAGWMMDGWIVLNQGTLRKSHIVRLVRAKNAC